MKRLALLVLAVAWLGCAAGCYSGSIPEFHGSVTPGPSGCSCAANR